MANDDHIAQLKKGVDAWNAWRKENPDIRPDLGGADLFGANLRRAGLIGANFFGANLRRADLFGANLHEANLGEGNLSRANLSEAKLNRADLSGADLSGANLGGANLSEAKLSRADLSRADLFRANLAEANLSEGNLSRSALLETDLTDSDLTGCRVYGVSVWNLKLERTKQQNLVITREDEPAITVDNIEVAQFIYLLLHNEKMILGRFTDERKAVLDALRDELRKHDYLPILFDFAVPTTRDITETVSLLARMARFIIADLTDPSSIPKELEAIVPSLAVPVQPLIADSSRPYAMFADYWKYDWVLPEYRYEGLEMLLAKLVDKVITPAEEKLKALQKRRHMIESKLTKPLRTPSEARTPSRVREPSGTDPHGKYSIFFSHKVNDEGVTKALKDLLHTNTENVEFHISGQIEKAWRDSSAELLNRANFLVVVSTDPNEDWGWCLYEAGFFDALSQSDLRRRIWCLCNGSINPPPIAKLQIIPANKLDVELWLKELFRETKQKELFFKKIPALAKEICKLF